MITPSRPRFRSRDLRCKSPYGAVAVDAEVKFSIFSKRVDAYSAFTLWIAQDGEEPVAHPLQWAELIEGHDCYSIAYVPQQSGLYWYWFTDQEGDKTTYLNRGFAGIGAPGKERGTPYQLTVCQSLAAPAAWFGQGITYNIFPDRFCRDKVPAKDGWRSARTIHENWKDTPDYLPDANGEILNTDFFGGSLQGVISKLDYLKSLHVQTIYFNPIFEAYSNHRYDTGDYKVVDPMMGTEDDLRMLCEMASKRGMRVVLDGVFSHNGYDSRYFNARGNYDSVGAYQSEQSPYASWYDFYKFPDRYASWWGIYTLPQVNELDDNYLDYIIRGQDSVIRHWLRAGVSGWRLDVADELPDEFLQHLIKAAREEKPDALVVGEVWEDASNKTAYDVRRTYFSECELDSVMNYPLRDAILRFLGGGQAADFEESMETIRENYPKGVFYNLMNIVGTHDTPRILSLLGDDNTVWDKDKTYRANARLIGDALLRARDKMKLAAVLQFAMPGSPTIYYGDEAGMQGFEDPLNRRPYPWGDEDGSLMLFYRKLTAIYAKYDAFAKGDLQYLQAENSLLVLQRSLPAQEGKAAQRLVVVINRSPNRAVQANMPIRHATELLTDAVVTLAEDELLHVPPMTAAIYVG